MATGATSLYPDYRGPYASGAPPSALEVRPPSLTRFGAREVRRLIVGTWTLGAAIVGALVKRKVAAVLHRPGPTRLVAAAEGAVDGFERLGPSWVKIGQIIASSPGMFPKTLPLPWRHACRQHLGTR